MKKITLTLALALVGATFLFAASAHTAYAASKKVDCDAVMNELNSGKKAKDVAVDLKISRQSVYRCKKKSKAPRSMMSVKAPKPAAAPAPAPAAAPAAAPAPAPAKAQ